jgi:hypothetical protein
MNLVYFAIVPSVSSAAYRHIAASLSTIRAVNAP